MPYNEIHRSLDAAEADEPGQRGNPAAISRNLRVCSAVCFFLGIPQSASNQLRSKGEFVRNFRQILIT